MKVIKMYDVLKMVTIGVSRNDGSVIFIDDTGRIYFIDKNKTDCYDKLDADSDTGKVMLAWVTNETEKVGFVAIAIDNVMLSEYITTVLADDEDFKDRCLKRELYRDETQLFNYLYNHDLLFRDKMCLSDKHVGDVTKYIRQNDTYISEDPNIKTPTMMAVAREYVVNTYSGM